MRKIVLSLAMLGCFGVAHAESGSTQLFSCMDDKTFEVSEQCVADSITQNVNYQNAQVKIAEVASESQGDFVIATMTFDPRKMQIDIVAHKDAMSLANKLAALRSR